MTFIYVGIGGFMGALSRYIIGLYLSKITFITVPAGTITVNIIGCFIAGLLVDTTCNKLLIVTGFLGAFTTFSAFTSETFKLIESNKIPLAILYTISNITLCIFTFFLGHKIRHMTQLF